MRKRNNQPSSFKPVAKSAWQILGANNRKRGAKKTILFTMLTV
jgi:hypothetical protein